MTLYTPIERLAVRLQHCPGVGPVALRLLLERIDRSGLSPARWLELDDAALIARFALKPPAIQALRQQQDVMEALLEKLAAHKVRILVAGHPPYPRRLDTMLGTTAPPLLYAIGSLELMDLSSVGFCGSRKASPKGISVTQECASILAAEHINVVSGYASGVDMAAHEAALAAGGSTTIVLAEGIQHFRVKQPLRQFVSGLGGENYLVVSEFPPALAWKAHNAMTRNRTICGLSNALIVIESGLDGGTFEAGKTALSLREPLFCVEYAEPSPSAAGNPWLLANGAQSLKRSRSGPPNLAHVLAAARAGMELNALREDPPHRAP